MRGIYVPGEGYIDVTFDQWQPKRDEDAQFTWPPRTIRRALPVAKRARDTRARRKAHTRIVRAAARFGAKVSVTRR